MDVLVDDRVDLSKRVLGKPKHMGCQNELTAHDWVIIEPLIPPPRRTAAGRGQTRARCFTASYEFCAVASGGRICQSGSHRTRPATASSSSRRVMAHSDKCSKHWLKTSSSAADSTGRNALLMARWRSPKKGCRVGKTKRGEGTRFMGSQGKLYYVRLDEELKRPTWW